MEKSTVFPCQTSPITLSQKIHSVMVMDEKNVEATMMLEVSTWSARIFFAMTKQDTVVAEPVMIRMAIIWLFRKPNMAANGRKIPGSRNSFTRDETAAPFQRFRASPPEKDAPTTRRAMGVAVAPMELRDRKSVV